jgi:hypothetical protein
MTRGVVAIMAALLVLPFWEAAGPPTGWQGSLIVAVPTSQGVVACSDQRRHNYRTGTDRDDQVKIHQIGRNAFYAVAGVFRCDECTSTVLGVTTSFDLYQVVDTFFHGKDTADLEAYWEPLKRHISDSLREAGEGLSLLVTALPKRRENTLFEMMVMYLDRTGSLKSELYKCTYADPGSSDFSMTVVYGPATNVDLSKAQPIILGDSQVYAELRTGTKLEFKYVRQSDVVKPFLSDFRPRGQVSPNEALAFEYALIEATAQGGYLVAKDIHVSKTCNCALLGFQSGFRWISQDDFPAPKPTPH